MKQSLKILNWGHRRATAPITAAVGAFRNLKSDVTIELDVQPLSGFEHGLSERIVDSYDLVIFDHPFCGAIARDGLLRPLPQEFASLRDADFVGKSLPSYRYAGQLWALPIDAATQTAVYRADLLAAYGHPPASFAEVLTLGTRARERGKYLGMACLNPHGFLVVSAFCASLGAPLATDPWTEPFDRSVMREALGALKAITDLSRPDCVSMNAIDLHDAMRDSDDIVYCPAAYIYLTYAEADMRRRLSFAAFPGLSKVGDPSGTILGGTGLGITRGCRNTDAAAHFVRMLATAEAQRSLIAGNHGQAGHVAAWDDPEIDAVFAGALTATRTTIDRAIVRPRHPASIPIQHACGSIVEAFAKGEIGAESAIERMYVVWRERMPDIAKGKR